MKDYGKILLSVLALLLSGCSAWDKDPLTLAEHRLLAEYDGKLEVLFGYQTPPNAYHDDSGRYVGLLVDFQREIERHLGIRMVSREFATWNELMDYAKAGRDFIILGIARTTNRAEFLNFSNPFIKVPYVIATRKRSSVSTLSELNGREVCAVVNYAVKEYVALHYPEIRLVGVRDNLSGLRALSAGDCEAMIVDQTYASYLIESQGITNLRIGGETGYLNRLSAATPVTNPRLFAILEKAIDQIDTDRQWTLYRRWVGVGPVGDRGRFLVALSVAAGIGTGLLILFWAWTLGLRRQVRLKVAQLQESERRSMEIINNIPDLLYRTDVDGRVVFISSSAEKISGYTQEQLIGMNLAEDVYVDPEERKQFLQILKNKGSVENYEVKLKRKDQSIRWGSASARALTDANGKLIGVEGIVRDVTERKLAEEALRETEQRFRAIAESTQQVFWLVSLDAADGRYRVLYVNPAFEQVWQRRAEEVYRDADVWYACIQPEDRQRVTDAFSAFCRGERPFAEEFRITPPDGVVKMIWSSGNLIRNNQGKIIQAAGVAQDITEQRRAEKGLRRAQKMDAVGQMAGGIAHDFNNILSIILGNLGLLQMQLDSQDEKTMKRLETIKKSAQRAADLTKQLLGFSRRQPTELKLTNINHLVGEMQGLVIRSVTPEVEVEHRLAPELWLTEIDPGDFEDALLNLIINARDAMAGGGRLILETANCQLDNLFCANNPGSHPGDYVQLAVSDTGVGIPLEHQEHVFEPFFTTKHQGKGTGLGLAMVFGFVKRSGGYIQVYSEIGVGTTFRLYLPRCEGEEQRVQSSEPGQAPPRGAETVLAVDDEQGLLELAKTSLEALGYRVLTAGNGQRALQLLSGKEPIDLLFSDVVMPGGINGYELAERALKLRPQLKILLTSGYTEKVMARNGQARFNANLLSKPYTQGELALRLRSLLDQGR